MTVAARPAGRSGGKAAARASGRAPARRRGTTARSAAPVRSVRAAVVVGGGLVWAALLIFSVAVSSLLTVVVLVPVGAIATASGWRAAEARASGARGRRRSIRQWPFVLVVAMGASLLDPLVALGGPYPALAILLVSTALITASVAVAGYAASARPLRAVGGRWVVAVGPSVAVTSVVVARHQGSSLALALVAAALAYDAGSFVMGHGRSAVGGWLGVLFGLASVAVVAVFAAALMDPPFSGSKPWVVFAAVAVLAPIGARLSQAAAGGERLPAVRRLDSLWLAAPVWVVLVALLLHR